MPLKQTLPDIRIDFKVMLQNYIFPTPGWRSNPCEDYHDITAYLATLKGNRIDTNKTIVAQSFPTLNSNMCRKLDVCNESQEDFDLLS